MLLLLHESARPFALGSLFSWEMWGEQVREGEADFAIVGFLEIRTGHAEQNDFLGGEFLAGVVALRDAAGGDAAGFFGVGDVAVGGVMSVSQWILDLISRSKGLELRVGWRTYEKVIPDGKESPGLSPDIFTKGWSRRL